MQDTFLTMAFNDLPLKLINNKQPFTRKQAQNTKMLIVESFDPTTGTLVTRTADYQPEEGTV